MLGGRNAQRVAFLTIPPGLALVVAIAVEAVQSGGKLVYLLGGWVPPLGVALRADGLSVVMLLATALIILRWPSMRAPTSRPRQAPTRGARR